MRHKMSLSILILSILLCVILAFSACGSPVVGGDEDNLQKVNYTNVYPDNEFTRAIPKPEYGTVQYTTEFLVDKNKFAISFDNITRAEADSYVDTLIANGFKVSTSTVESASSGYLLYKNKTNISLSCTEGVMTMLITLDK